LLAHGQWLFSAFIQSNGTLNVPNLEWVHSLLSGDQKLIVIWSSGVDHTQMRSNGCPSVLIVQKNDQFRSILWNFLNFQLVLIDFFTQEIFMGVGWIIKKQVIIPSLDLGGKSPSWLDLNVKFVKVIWEMMQLGLVNKLSLMESSNLLQFSFQFYWNASNNGRVHSISKNL